MQSRREQVHAYQFLLHRAVSGLVRGESDPTDLPFGRLGGAALGSLMVAVLCLAGVGIYGLVVSGGATSWRDGQAIIVERETGTRYVYLQERLHPVANFASARLVLEREAPIRTVSSESLVGVPRGPAIGIDGAPDALPDPGRLLPGGWTLCSHVETDPSGDRYVASTLGVGRVPDGGAAVGERALLVREGAGAGSPGRLHLVWNDRRHELVEPATVLVALGTGDDAAIDVGAAWLNALPQGEPIRSPAPDRPGEPSSALAAPGLDPALRSGQVVESAGAFYLAGPVELQPITPLQAEVALADPATGRAYEPDGLPVRARPVDPAAVAGAGRADPPPPAPTRPPPNRPEILRPTPQDQRDGAVCAAFDQDRFEPRVLVGARLPGAAAGVTTPQRTEEGALLAARVLVEPGWGALVEALSSPEATTGSWHLVTDLGTRHAIPGSDVAALLGYAGVRPVRLPASLVDRVPEGPVLDPAAARRPTPIR